MDTEHSAAERLEQLADEFVERVRHGGNPRISEFAGRHPELARDIESLFPALAKIEQLKPDSSSGEPGAPAVSTEATPPSKFGDFRIIREVGRGGGGVVYEAEQESLGRRVALKILAGRWVADDLQRMRFQREARAAGRLHHTHIVPVFGVGEHEGIAFYVMQFIRGQGLDAILDELRRLGAGAAEWERQRAVQAPPQPSAGEQLGADLEPAHGTDSLADSLADTWRAGDRREPRRSEYWRNVARIGLDVADALAYAHSQGVVHRDIKPANLLLDCQGHVWVADFGLAKADDQLDLTATGDVLGTLRYMAPEQMRGEATERSDVYSLGATLYELLTLRPMYDGADRAALMRQVLNDTPPAVRRVSPDIPRDLATIVEKATEREPNQRYASAADLAADLRRFLADEPIAARPLSSAARAVRWCRKNRLIALFATLAIMSLFAALAVLGASRWQLRRQRDDLRIALGDSLVNEARFRRLSGQAGQRVASLRTLAQARQLGLLESLRDEVVRCLSLHDLDRQATWPAEFPSYSLDAVAFDSDLRHYVSYARDAIEVRRVPSASGHEGELAQRIPWEPFEPRCARFSPDGEMLAVRMDDDERSRLVVWAWREGRRVLEVRGAVERAFDLHPDGRQVVCGVRRDGRYALQVFELEQGERLWSWDLPSNPCVARYDPRGERIACSLPEAHQVLVWTNAAAELPREVPLGEDIYGIAWHPWRNRLAVGHGYDVLELNLDQESPARTYYLGHRWMVHAVDYHPSGEFLVSHSLREGITRLWDTRRVREACSTRGNYARFDESGGQLAVVGAGSLELYACEGEVEYRTLAERQAGFADSWRAIPHPRWPLVLECGRGGLRIWEIERRRVVASRLGAPIYTACFDPRTGELLTAGEEGTQRWAIAWDPAQSTAKLAEPLPCDWGDEQAATSMRPAYALVCSLDGKWQAAIFQGSDRLLVREVESGRVRALPCDRRVKFLAISPDGKWIAAGNHDTVGFFVWDSRSESGPRRLAVASSAAQVEFSPDGQWLLASSNDRYSLLRVGSWDISAEYPRQAAIEGAAAFSTDGRLLAVTSGADEVELRDSQSGRLLAKLVAERDPINILNVRFSSDDSLTLWLACGAEGLREWRLAPVRDKLRELQLDW